MVIVFVLCVCSGLVGELCGLAFWWRQDSSVQNDANFASAETAEGFGSLSGHEGKQTKTKQNKKKKEKYFYYKAPASLFAFLFVFVHFNLSIENVSSPFFVFSAGALQTHFNRFNCMIVVLANGPHPICAQSTSVRCVCNVVF